MIINDIINPYSVIENQEILFCEINQFQNMYQNDALFTDDNKKKKIIDSNKSNKNINNSTNNLSPTIIPNNLQQLKVDEKNKSVKVINSFQ